MEEEAQGLVLALECLQGNGCPPESVSLSGLEVKVLPPGGLVGIHEEAVCLLKSSFLNMYLLQLTLNFEWLSFYFFFILQLRYHIVFILKFVHRWVLLCMGFLSGQEGGQCRMLDTDRGHGSARVRTNVSDGLSPSPHAGLIPEPQVTGPELSPAALAHPQLTHMPLVCTHGSRKGTSWGSWETTSAGAKLSASVSRLGSCLPVREPVPGEADRRTGSHCSRTSWTLSL